MHWWYDGWSMGWMGIWWLTGVALIALVVWALLRSQRGQEGPRDSAEGILKRRYASGEIDRETYQRMLRDLKG